MTKLRLEKSVYPGSNIVKSEVWVNRDDQFHGEYRENHPSGSLALLVVFELGKRVGNFLELYANGVTKTQGQFCNDMHDGEWLRQFPNGNIASLGRYSGGKEFGHWDYYFPPDPDRPLQRPRKKCAGEYDNGYKEGQWEFYSKATGRIQRVVTYFCGSRYGDTIAYLANGTIKITTYIDDEVIETSRIEQTPRRPRIILEKPVPSKHKTLIKHLKNGGVLPEKYVKLSVDNECPLSLEKITGAYLKCANPHPHYFDANYYANGVKTMGEACCVCPIDRTFEIDKQRYTTASK